MTRRFLARIIQALACALLLLVADPAGAQQNLIVRPMKVEAAIPANRTARVSLSVRNSNQTRAETLDIAAVELVQNRKGDWSGFSPGELETRSGDWKQFSNREWIELPFDTLEIEPGAAAEIPLRINIPRDARGTYFSAVTVQTRAPEAPEGPASFTVNFRFLIPIIIEIEGRPVRQRIQVADLDMVFTGDDPAFDGPTTLAMFHIANEGRSFPRIQGQMLIEREFNGRWRQVTRFAVPKQGIAPGVKLALKQDLERRLPSGTYRLRGDLSVDGRRIAPLVKEIQFEGDPSIDALAYDTALTLDPEMVELSVAPGATRTAALTIENPGEDAVDVAIGAITPHPLRGVAIGALRGEDLSAAPWIQVRPAAFTIRPGGRRNVRIMSRVPREGVAHPNYYAALVLTGRYGDGQSAGETRSTIHLMRKEVESTASGVIERLTLAEGEDPSQYVLQTRFTNTGNTHLEPRVNGQLANERGAIVQSARLTGEEDWLLPLEMRDYAGIVDFSNITSGDYTLGVMVEFGEAERARKQIPIRVDIEEGGNKKDGDTSPPVRHITVIHKD